MKTQGPESPIKLLNPLLEPGSAPRMDEFVYDLPRSMWQDLREVSGILTRLGIDVWRRYKAGDSGLIRYVEYGLPKPILEMLREEKTAPNGKFLRFDFLITNEGASLVEVSRNPWALLIYEDEISRRPLPGVYSFPAKTYYEELFRSSSSSSIGIWPAFDAYEEAERILALASEKGLTARRIQENFREESPGPWDGCVLADLDAAWMGGGLTTLLAFQRQIQPPVAHVVFKHKSFLAIASDVVLDHLDLGLSQREKEKLRRYCVLSHLIEDCDDRRSQLPGAVKEVVGAWSRQVTLLPPEVSESSGQYARVCRKLFRRHFRSAKEKNNAICQDFIEPKVFDFRGGTSVELSAVQCGEDFFPFCRVYKHQERSSLRDVALARVRMAP